MKRCLIKHFYVVFSLLLFLLFSITPAAAQPKELTEKVQQVMLEATQYMVEEVSTNGGYVYHYLPDFSRRWGELEAYRTQIWIQSSGGTLDMGHLFLDAYGAIGNEYYYRAATKVGQALMWGQLPTGGWHYMVDFGGDRSLKRWYNTIGENAWGFEEFYHYYGNATFDDGVSAEAAKFLLRLYLVKLDPAFKPSLDKAIEFILESQYPLGGWPQRYPLNSEFPHGKGTDYTPFYTFNDGVTRNNIEFLIDCYQTLGQERLLDPIRRGMNFYLLTQQGNPQGGWAQQYNMQLEPAHGRSFEPAALSTGVTYNLVELLMQFYRYTGDQRYLSRIPDAINWLERSRLPEKETEGGKRTHPYFVEMGTNKPLYAHRRGTGVNDGKYWIDYSNENAYGYGYPTKLNLNRLQSKYRRVRALSPEEVTQGSPLKVQRSPEEQTPQEKVDLSMDFTDEIPSASEVQSIIGGLDEKGRWLTQHEWVSDPYTVTESGNESNTALHSKEITAKGIRDQSDQQYISTREYIRNMKLLINYITRQILQF